MEYTMTSSGLLHTVTLVMLIFCVLVNGASYDTHVYSRIKTETSCKYPSSLWCSSLHIAEQCQVSEQCKRNVWQKEFLPTIHGSADDRVQFALYYEALCPDCQEFVGNQLWPTYKKIGEIIDLNLVPYGNANEQWDGNQWQFTCQHGPKECHLNLIQTCAIHVAGLVNASFPFIACMEMGEEAEGCAKKHGIDMKAVTQCVEGPLGNKLEHDMAIMTDNLSPPHQFVPWVTLHGEHTGDIQHRAETDLLGLICEAYKGTKVPSACQSSDKGRRCKKA